MHINKKHLIGAGISLSIFLVLIVIPFGITAFGEGGDESEWIWTKELPKPSWWKWDKSYSPSEPVRGGVFQSAATRYIGLMNPNHWPVND